MNAQQIIINATEKLLSVCDGANELDGMGFNRNDTIFARSVYAQFQQKGSLSPKQLKCLKKSLLKYKGQLIAMGLDYDALANADISIVTPKKTSSSLTISDLENLNFSEKEWVSRLDKFVQYAELPNGFWDLYNSNKSAVKGRGFGVSKYRTGNWELVWYTSEEVEKEVKTVIKKYSKTSNNYNLDPLYDYQRDHAVEIINSLSEHDRAVDNSDTGTGKTYVAVVVCRELGLKPIVICPKPVIPAWNKTLKNLGVEALTVVNYELIKTGKMRSGKKHKTTNCPYLEVVKNEKRVSKYDEKYFMTWNLPKNAILIFDEAHRTKNKNTLNTQLMTSASEYNARILMLSATIGESPMKMFGVAKALRFYNHPSEFYSWIQQYDCYKGRYSWEYHGNMNTMTRLRESMKPFMDGMNVDELIKNGQFPQNKVFVEAYDMNSNADHIQKIYDECAKELAELQSKEDKIPYSNVLALMQKARQKTELYKVPTLVERAKDLIVDGFSVTIFVNYTATLNKLVEVLGKELKEKRTSPTVFIPTIYGGNNSKTNEANRVIFQENKSSVIVCNIQASREGIDLHDENHERKRVSLIIPDWNAQNLKQVLGRIHRAGGTNSLQYVVFCANTVEERVLEKVQYKMNNIEALNKGDLAIFEMESV